MLLVPERNFNLKEPGIFYRDMQVNNYIGERSFRKKKISIPTELRILANETELQSPVFVECYQIARKYIIEDLVKSDNPYFVSIFRTKELINDATLRRVIHKSKIESIFTKVGDNLNKPSFPMCTVLICEPATIRKSDTVLSYDKWVELCQLEKTKIPS